MEEMRGSQGRQETRHMSKGPGVGKTSDNEETAKRPVGRQQRARGRTKVIGSERRRSDKGLDLPRLDGRGLWVRFGLEGCSGMLDPATQAQEGRPSPSSVW